jgi:1-acyl-sn-glycerol-3-phosphate acyltransferase
VLDRRYLADYRVLPSAAWEAAVTGAFHAMSLATRTRVTLRDARLPPGPVIFASNSTQKYDFMPLRQEAARLGWPLVTVTKAKNYHSRAMRPVLERTGVLPLASKGYVILVDVVASLGRRPEDAEYRALRRHLDEGVPLPESPDFLALQRRPRTILGYPYHPSSETLREGWRRAYRGLLGETLRLAREAVGAGHHLHIYPEGTVSGRLGPGRAGVMQLAWALDLPVVPLAMSGCRDAFRGQGLWLRGGEIELRFGEPYRPDLSALPPGFRPFDPDDEQTYRPALQRATDDLMDRLDALLPPGLRRAAEAGDPGHDTRRFL